MDIRDIIKAGGGATKLARACGLHHTTVLEWKHVPLKHVKKVEELTGIKRDVLRVDVWGEATND